MPEAGKPEPDKAADDRLVRALDDYAAATSQVSANNRYISFGLVAITYTLLASDSPFAVALIGTHGFLVLLVGASGCLGVVFDYLHYLCAVQDATRAIDNTTPGHAHQYNKKWPAYIWRERFYRLRTAAALSGAGVLIILIVLSFGTLLADTHADDQGSHFGMHHGLM